MSVNQLLPLTWVYFFSLRLPSGRYPSIQGPSGRPPLSSRSGRCAAVQNAADQGADGR